MMKRHIELPQQFKMTPKDKAQIFTFSIPDAILFSNLPRTEILLFGVYYGFKAQGRSCHWTDYQLACKLHSSRSRISSYTNDLEKRGLIYCDKYKAHTPYGIKPRRAVIGINYDYCRKYSDNVRHQRSVPPSPNDKKASRQPKTKKKHHEHASKSSSHTEHSSQNKSSYTEHSSNTEQQFYKRSICCSNTEQQFYKRPISCSVYELTGAVSPASTSLARPLYYSLYNSEYYSYITPNKTFLSSSLRAPRNIEAPEKKKKGVLQSSVSNAINQLRDDKNYDESKYSRTPEVPYENDSYSSEASSGSRGYHHKNNQSSQKNKTDTSQARHPLPKEKSALAQENAYNKKLPTKDRDFTLMSMLVGKSTYYQRAASKWKLLGASRPLIIRALSKANDNLPDKDYTIRRIVAYARTCINNDLTKET